MARTMFTKLLLIASIWGLISLAPVSAQVESVDPNDVIGQVPDAPELPNPELANPKLPSADLPTNQLPTEELPSTDDISGELPLPDDSNLPSDVGTQSDPIGDAQNSTTYQQDDVLAAATGVFGKGAEGLASIVEDIFRKQGEPNGYIVGREGGGAIVFGLRYGSGTLFHKIEGERPVYWNGPSVGFDLGANVAKTFVLVYNLYDSEDLYRRYPAGEGAAYLVGGFNASYLRRGDVVLIPIRLGVGARLGVNAGYNTSISKFT